MTVVDVNTGKFTGSGGNLEETVTKNNLEAAEEIVRQLRLRDIGGIIVVDFIDMVLESNRDLVLRRLVECLGRDRTRHQVAEVTSLGLVQMTRKRIGTGLLEAFSETCEHCQGRGLIIHHEPVEAKQEGRGGAPAQPPQRTRPRQSPTVTNGRRATATGTAAVAQGVRRDGRQARRREAGRRVAGRRREARRAERPRSRSSPPWTPGRPMPGQAAQPSRAAEPAPEPEPEPDVAPAPPGAAQGRHLLAPPGRPTAGRTTRGCVRRHRRPWTATRGASPPGRRSRRRAASGDGSGDGDAATTRRTGLRRRWPRTCR